MARLLRSVRLVFVALEGLVRSILWLEWHEARCNVTITAGGMGVIYQNLFWQLCVAYADGVELKVRLAGGRNIIIVVIVLVMTEFMGSLKTRSSVAIVGLVIAILEFGVGVSTSFEKLVAK